MRRPKKRWFANLLSPETLTRSLACLRRTVAGEYPIFLDYPVSMSPRRGDLTPLNLRLFATIDGLRTRYGELLRDFLRYMPALSRIPVHKDDAGSVVHWNNGWFGGIDAVALYGLVASLRPRMYVEVGSGFSTWFARRAVDDQGLATQMVAIDPKPRAEVQGATHRAIPLGLERIDLGIFDELGSGDIVFLDGSHRSFKNSDSTIFFTEVLPRLKPGVLVQLHDIFLPYDYPEEWNRFYYSEQYLLAMLLLAQVPCIEVVLPNAFICRDRPLSGVLEPLWQAESLEGVWTQGQSFWFRARF